MIKMNDYASPIRTYTCPVCNKQHQDYNEACACVDSHNTPESLIGFEGYHEAMNTVDSVIVRLKDGQEVTYVLAEAEKVTKAEVSE